METNDRAGVLDALLAQGRGLPRLGSGADYLAYDVEQVCFAAYDGMGGWQMEEAERLYHAERCRLPQALVSRRRKGLTLEDAYRVQWCGAALRVREGARVLGHKVGLTSKAMQHQVGIDTPDSGILLDYMVVARSEVLRAAELLSPRIEAEIAFRLGTDLCGTAPLDMTSVTASTPGPQCPVCPVGTNHRIPRDSLSDPGSCLTGPVRSHTTRGKERPHGRAGSRRHHRLVGAGGRSAAVQDR